ncbi:hypothetical protein AXJ18_gp198 [Streptomyces phage Jay2Jay]|uniref:Uncharacterized protein n=2 Tax=Samistivirus jay2jay TaxID=2560786 RepID=A0A221SAY9_9CAUD|nr:hypothetical protein AXJ18_gp198 [Streptomyces phage Jay2Jay]AIW02576.1 hypothetical protein PBI_JAY2JAY_78 [Streptomyces phage Jay2Jay]ASN73151.1 hypothetical protein SEA_WARPY_77 [Streptomyces phage Warpy]
MATAKYTPFGDRLDPSIAIVQAANALDVAAKFAVETKDSRALIDVARSWVELSGRLGYDDEEEDDEPENEERRSFGFSVTSDIGEEDAEDDGSEG